MKLPPIKNTDDFIKNIWKYCAVFTVFVLLVLLASILVIERDEFSFFTMHEALLIGFSLGGACMTLLTLT